MTNLNVKYGFVVEPKGSTPSLIEQVHGNELIEVSGNAGLEALELHPPQADGLFTSHPETSLHIFTADCLPILFYSHKMIAAVHCGWRGALRGIAAKTLKLFSKNVTVVFGPSILPCCFEVKADFVAEF